MTLEAVISQETTQSVENFFTIISVIRRGCCSNLTFFTALLQCYCFLLQYPAVFCFAWCYIFLSETMIWLVRYGRNVRQPAFLGV